MRVKTIVGYGLYAVLFLAIGLLIYSSSCGMQAPRIPPTSPAPMPPSAVPDPDELQRIPDPDQLERKAE